nr:rhomboid family intramembrane serine protease [uncultured Desulfobulbus sp.]
MVSSKKNNALLCPNCRKLISRSVDVCPYCGLSHPGSLLKANPLIQGTTTSGALRLLLIINVVMFVLAVLIDFHPSMMSLSPFSFLSPSSRSLLVLGATGSYPLFGLHHWWSLVAASFLHGGLLHILFNMGALYQIGPMVGQEFGTGRMILIYLLSGVGGFLLSAIMGVTLTIGASASICGLIGAMLYYGKHRGGTYGSAVFSQIGGWALGLALFGFIVPGINNWGHGGGMAAGFLLAMLLGYKERTRETIYHKIFAVSCMIITGLILCWGCFNGLLYLLAAR